MTTFFRWTLECVLLWWLTIFLSIDLLGAHSLDTLTTTDFGRVFFIGFIVCAVRALMCWRSAGQLTAAAVHAVLIGSSVMVGWSMLLQRIAALA